MATLVQSTPIAPAGSGASPITATFGAATTPGNLVVVFVVTAVAPTPISIASTHDTLTVDNVGYGNDATDGAFVVGGYKFNVVGGDTVFTITQGGGSVNLTASAIEFAGAGTGTLRGNTNGATTSGTSVAATALGAANDLIVAGFYTGTGNTTAITATGGLTLLRTDLSNADLNGTSYLLAASGSTTPGFTWSGTAGGACIYAMALTPSGPPPPPTLMAQICLHDFEHLGWDRNEESPILMRRPLARRSPRESWPSCRLREIDR